MSDYFNTLSTNLRNVQTDANNEIKDTVDHINTLAQNITALNKQINQIEACYYIIPDNCKWTVTCS